MVDRPVQHNHGGRYLLEEVNHLRDMLYPARKANRMMSDLCVSRLDFDRDSIGLRPGEIDRALIVEEFTFLSPYLYRKFSTEALSLTSERSESISKRIFLKKPEEFRLVLVHNFPWNVEQQDQAHEIKAIIRASTAALQEYGLFRFHLGEVLLDGLLTSSQKETVEQLKSEGEWEEAARIIEREFNTVFETNEQLSCLITIRNTEKTGFCMAGQKLGGELKRLNFLGE